MPIPAVILPLGALVTGRVLVAVPVLILVSVWAAVNALRVLFPERPLRLESAVRWRRVMRRRESVPVRLRDIQKDQAQRQSASGLEGDADEPEARTGHPLFDGLSIRRN